MTPPLIFILRAIFQFYNRRLVKKFDQSLKQASQTQDITLKSIIENLSTTKYGKHYQLNAKDSYEDFANKLPIVNFAEVQPWIELIEKGEGDVLFPGRPLCFEKTSGSSGVSKLVPYNRAILTSFERLFRLWADDLLRHGPELESGRVYLSLSPLRNTQALSSAKGPPIGFEDDLSYLRGPSGWLLSHLSAVPASVKSIRDSTEFRKVVATYLVACRNLEVISVWSPTFFEGILEEIEQGRAWILNALSVGNLTIDRVPFRFPRPPLQTHTALNSPIDKPIDFTTIWPHLKLVSCWDQGPSRMAADRLRTRLPHTLIQGKGLLATEAPITFPKLGIEGGIPLIDEVFFEFIDDQGHIRRLHELSLGEMYELVFTTKSGLVRYKIGDCVKVTGVLHATSTLEFIGRTATCDLVGEKLGEPFVHECLQKVTPSGASISCLIPDFENRRYLWITDVKSTEVTQQTLLHRLDQELRRSFHYDHARAMGQLKIIGWHFSPSARTIFYEYYENKGLRLGDIKLRPLITSLEDAKKLLVRFQRTPAAGPDILTATAAGTTITATDSTTANSAKENDGSYFSATT